MALTVHLPEELARRVEDAAAARQMTAEQVAIEAIESRFPATGDQGDALEAFIGSGDSGDSSWAERDARELRAEALRRATA
jgi:hypothetical protein